MLPYSRTLVTFINYRRNFREIFCSVNTHVNQIIVVIHIGELRFIIHKQAIGDQYQFVILKKLLILFAEATHTHTTPQQLNKLNKLGTDLLIYPNNLIFLLLCDFINCFTTQSHVLIFSALILTKKKLFLSCEEEKFSFG